MIVMSGGVSDRNRRAIALFEAGDELAFNQFYDQFAPLIYSIILQLVGDRKIAELGLRNAFQLIWQNRKSYCTQKGCIDAWLTFFARNAAYSLLHKTCDPDLSGFKLEQDSKCAEQLIRLIFVYGKSTQEICQLLNISHDTFKAVLKNAVQSNSKV